MSSYINRSLLEDLFAGVEMKASAEDRLASVNSLSAEFADLALNSLERIAYDFSAEGWTLHQIANEIGVARTYIPTMIAAHAARTGLPSPQKQRRSYEHAVDISGLVSREARLRKAAAAGPPAAG